MSLPRTVLFAELQIPDTYVLQHNSLDGYFLLRYLKICVVVCFVGCCMTWPVLLPINATGGAGLQQLDLLTFGQCPYLPQMRAWLTVVYRECCQQIQILRYSCHHCI